jgi:hypothetical protein
MTKLLEQNHRKRKFTADEAKEAQTVDIRAMFQSKSARNLASVTNILKKWGHHDHDIRRTVLHEAIVHACLDTTSWLLSDFETNPNTQVTGNGDSAIMTVVRASNHALLQQDAVKLRALEQILDTLVKFRGDVNTRDSEGESPIDIAAKTSNLRMIELLGRKYKAELKPGWLQQLTPTSIWRHLWRRPHLSAFTMAEQYEQQAAFNLLHWIAHERRPSACHQDSFEPQKRSENSNICPLCLNEFGVVTKDDVGVEKKCEPWVCVPCGHRCCGGCLEGMENTEPAAELGKLPPRCMICRTRPIMWRKQSECPATMKLYSRFCVQLPLTP